MQDELASSVIEFNRTDCTSRLINILLVKFPPESLANRLSDSLPFARSLFIERFSLISFDQKTSKDVEIRSDKAHSCRLIELVCM